MADATCAGCGCVCDDIEVTVAPARAVTRTRARDAWFAERSGDRRRSPASTGARCASTRRWTPRPRSCGRRARRSSTAWARRAARRSAGRWRSPTRSGPSIDPAAAAPGAAYQAIGVVHGDLRRDPRPGRARRRLAGGPGRHPPAPAGCAWTACRGSRALVVVDERRTATAEQADAFIELDRPRLRGAVGAARAGRRRAARSGAAARGPRRPRAATARRAPRRPDPRRPRRARRAGADLARARPQPRPPRRHAGAAR